MTTAPRWRVWTLSNGLTSLRLFASFPLYCAIVEGAWFAATLLFWLAVATDWFDGRVARARGESSALGGLLDHGTDATFVSLGLVACAVRELVPAILPALVIAAFVQYMLDSRALAGRPLRMSAVGRWNGIFYFVPIGIVTSRELLGLPQPADPLIRFLGWALVLTTCVSVVDRAWALIASRRESRR